jgi:hypothetical protein
MDGINWTRYGQLIIDARVIPGSLQAWQVSHVSTKAYEAAHRPAKEALCCLKKSFDGGNFHLYM